ncbi:MAG: hypothetical protein KA120_00240 [Candidatus Goldbacteria bacterium]|nr:hypothetical protein [Candidatus Goldiibacteriota bacterium]
MKIETMKTSMKGDVAEIPGADGLVLLRAGSEEHKKREKIPSILFFPVKEKDGSVRFLIATR